MPNPLPSLSTPSAEAVEAAAALLHPFMHPTHVARGDGLKTATEMLTAAMPALTRQIRADVIAECAKVVDKLADQSEEYAGICPDGSVRQEEAITRVGAFETARLALVALLPAGTTDPTPPSRGERANDE